jgi:hypothetical protein
MVGLRFETRRLCSGPPPLGARSATLVAASRLFIVYAGSPTILLCAAGRSSSFIYCFIQKFNK